MFELFIIYENGVLSHKDGYSCNKCGEVTKTMGLIRRHMKANHVSRQNHKYQANGVNYAHGSVILL